MFRLAARKPPLINVWGIVSYIAAVAVVRDLMGASSKNAQRQGRLQAIPVIVALEFVTAR